MQISEEIMLTYEQYVEYLLNKYGSSKYDYFKDESCTQRNQKGVRTNEGLFQHHIDECKAIKLSSPEFAIEQPFEYQKKERLVYCNYLEHLLLHIKIIEKSNIDKPYLGIGGAEMLWRLLNDMYSRKQASTLWQQECYNVIKDKYYEYIIMLGYLRNVVRSKEVLSPLFADVDFALGWNGKVIKGIYYDLKAILPDYKYGG